MKAYKMFFPLVGIVLVALALVGLSLLTPAAPISADTVPTPISVQHPGSPYVNVVFVPTTAQAASTNGSGIQLPSYKALDIQFVIDQTDVNTATLTLQYSNDNSNWSDGPAIVSNNAADADGMVQTANMGRYSRIISTLANTNPVTITVTALAH